jgi:hypothetical protein
LAVVAQKFCKRCAQTKDVIHFYKNKSLSGGLDFYCKDCHRLYKQTPEAKKRHKISNSKYYRSEKGQKARCTEKRKMYKREYNKKRRKTDVNYRLRCNLRSRLSDTLSKNLKCGSAIKDLGCSLDQLKYHLEGKFQPGMTWNNYGKWHIDHIRPLAAFDLRDRSQFLQAVHYLNLQPLWAKDNCSKQAKVI